MIGRRAHLRFMFSAILTVAFSFGIAGCSTAAPGPKPTVNRDGKTIVYVLGTIHSQHLTSKKYSVDILKAAIRKADPDQILTEIPPDRFAKAQRDFDQSGTVSEPRVRIFPEYRDVIFPLSRVMKFEIVPTAAWTQQISDDRDTALRRISSDPSRKAQWNAHRKAQSDFAKAVGNRGDDPSFIHTPEYDVLVRESQTPYETYFDGDLGAGGWKNINAAHLGLVNGALNRISGQGKVIVVTFGAAHKYMIINSLMNRSDVILQDSRGLFQ